MRNNNDDDDDYDYSPNELANLSITNKGKHDSIINSNLSDNDTIDAWQKRNLDSTQDYLAEQRRNRRRYND